MSALNKDCAWCESRKLAKHILSYAVDVYKASGGELAKEFIQRAIENLEWIDGKRPCACEGKMKGRLVMSAMEWPPRPPTHDECSEQKRFGKNQMALWVRIGGYDCAAVARSNGQCVDLVVWSDGDFPTEAPSKTLHFCHPLAEIAEPIDALTDSVLMQAGES